MAESLIRSAVADDAMSMARVQLAGWRTAYRGIFPDDLLDGASLEDAAIKWHQRLATQGGVAVVATLAGTVCAIAAGGPPGREPRLDYPAEIYSLYLLPECRGCGLGRRLLASMFAAFRERSATAVYLCCLAGNEAGRGFFRRSGGEEIATAQRPSVGGLIRPSVAVLWSPEAMAAAALPGPLAAGN